MWSLCLLYRCLPSQLGTKNFIRLYLTPVTFYSTQKKENRYICILPSQSQSHSLIQSWSIISKCLFFSGVWSVCKDAGRGGEEGEEEQADAGQRRVQEDDGGGKADTKVIKWVFCICFSVWLHNSLAWFFSLLFLEPHLVNLLWSMEETSGLRTLTRWRTERPSLSNLWLQWKKGRKKTPSLEERRYE